MKPVKYLTARTNSQTQNSVSTISNKCTSTIPSQPRADTITPPIPTIELENRNLSQNLCSLPIELLSLVINYLSYKQIFQLLFVKKSIKNIIESNGLLKVIILNEQLTERIEFARKNDLSLKLKINFHKDIDVFKEFINNPENLDLVQRIKELLLGQEQMSPSPEFSQFKVGDFLMHIFTPKSDGFIAIANNLTFLSCTLNLSDDITIQNLPNLNYLDFHTTTCSINIINLIKLKSISFQSIGEKCSIILKQLPSLTDFSVQILGNYGSINFIGQFPNFESFSCIMAGRSQIVTSNEEFRKQLWSYKLWEHKFLTLKSVAD